MITNTEPKNQISKNKYLNFGLKSTEKHLIKFSDILLVF